MKGCTLIALASMLHHPAAHDGWQGSYEAGLKAAHLGHWTEARDCFTKASSIRHKDSSRPTLSPDNPSEPSQWRNGAPYSPNFLAAYSEYRIALDSKDPGDQTKEFTQARSEFEHLIGSGEKSRDAYFYVQLIDTRLNDPADYAKLVKNSKEKGHASWKVDEECLAPEEVSAMQLAPVNGADNPGGFVAATSDRGPAIRAGEVTTGATGQALNPIVPGLPLGNVPRMPDKFALVIGQDSGQPHSLSCAGFDASVIRDGLVDYAGYDTKNVVLIQNAPASSIMDQAKALAARVPQDGIVFVYYAGSGSSVQGHDYLACADTSSHLDAETMVAKAALYDVFLQKGARIFSFYEVNRPIENGYFFGSEVPEGGSVSQMEATIPDSEVSTTVANGHSIGLYANSFIQVLAELRSNRVPIYEFGWQVYNKMKRGNTGLAGGGGHQIPTLPVLNNLASDARF